MLGARDAGLDTGLKLSGPVDRLIRNNPETEVPGSRAVQFSDTKLVQRSD